MYERLLRCSGLEVFEALDQAWKDNWKSTYLVDEVEALWQAEEQWDEFLTKVDQVQMTGANFVKLDRTEVII